ncbi:hypothetical protein ACFE04_019377 [Oxalis oulophora]
MPKRNTSALRAWKILQIATVLCARKGGVWKRRMLMELRLPKFLKTIGGNQATPPHRLHYEFSFDETPMFNVEKIRSASMRFLIPCLATPQVDFDYDLDKHEQSSAYDEICYDYNCDDQREQENVLEEEEEEGIDLKAEKFIKNFYVQMKLQRQMSYLEYKERQTNS